MDLQTRQLVGRNRMGYIANNVISISILLLTILNFVAQMRIALIVRAVVIVEAMVLNYVLHKRMMANAKYVHVCCSSMIVVFAATLATSQGIGMYVIMFPIAIMVMIFSDNLLALAGGVVAMVGLCTYGISLIVRNMAEVSDMVVAVLFGGISCFLAILVTRLQNKQNKESLEAMRETAEIQIETSKKIVELARELNTKFVSAKEVSEALNESMATSHSSVSAIADSTKTNAQAIEQQTSQTSDIQSGIQEVGTQAKNIGEISTRTNDKVEEGVVLIHKLKDQAIQVVDINHETRKITTQLNESIQGVQEITETILGISNQTNLLALNASIEAARAGEAGKGFAVVADEIRALSEDTRVATEQISDIIGRLTQDAEKASTSMMRSAESAERQNKLISQTEEKLAEIKMDADELYDGVRQVNQSVENIISATSRIMGSITNLSETGEQVASSSETALSISDTSMEALNDMNKLLENISEISGNMEQVAKQ